jgi:hypothetical protein
MPFKQNTALRNVVADAFGDEFDGGTLEIRSGAAPGPNAGAAGTVLATITLPTPGFGAASGGVVGLAGTWEDTAADATGTAAHFRLSSSGGTYVCEGTVTVTGGGGDLTVENVSFATGQAFNITGFNVTWGTST